MDRLRYFSDIYELHYPFLKEKTDLKIKLVIFWKL